MTTPESRTVERLAAIKRRDAAWSGAEFDGTHEHPETQCSADHDRHFLLAAAKEHGLVIGEGELDRAWKEAEAALPEDYTLELKSNGRTAYFAASLPPFLPYEQWFAARREAFGLSPAEALQGLVERLREIPEESRR